MSIIYIHNIDIKTLDKELGKYSFRLFTKNIATSNIFVVRPAQWSLQRPRYPNRAKVA